MEEKLFRKHLREFIKENNLVTAKDAQDAVKSLMGQLIEEMLEAELENELGYSRYDYRNKKTNNTRNGRSKKTVKTELGPLEIDVPRDRDGEFEPIVVKKRQRDISSIEDQILSMYAKGMSTRDIQDHLERIYGFQASPALISNITDKILPVIREWQNRPLQQIYPFVFIDAVHYSVRQDGQVVKKAAYVVIGIDLDGKKDVLGIWIGESESARFWLSVLSDIKNRGVEDILIISADNLAGISQAIKATFPQAEVQKCVVHQIRNSLRYVSYKDRSTFVKDLKAVYKAVNHEEALAALEALEAKWQAKYPLAVRSWVKNWDELSTCFNYPPEIRGLIYTTNIIEAFHRQLRKVTKSKAVLPNDDALIKILYLVTMDVTEKWTVSVKNWGLILTQLIILFKERIKGYL